MALLTVSDLRKEVNGEPLFERVSFTVERRDRLALLGPNGAGKTTLLHLVAGESQPDGGTVALRKGARVSLHDQRPPREREVSLREYVLSGATALVAIEGELRRLERAMSDGYHDVDTLHRYASAQAQLERAGGYGWRDRAAAIARGVGFSSLDLDRPLETFSGGELTRASLARALGAEADLLLLDEPTNHLDVESIEWLERELASVGAAVVLVAHDRWFLEAVTNATLELEAGRSTYFRGPWHAWRREKAERALQARKTVDRVTYDIARLERFVERFRSQKTKAKQAQAKLAHIARLERERAQAEAEAALLSRRRRSLAFEFLHPPRSGRTVVEVRDVRIAAGEALLLDCVSFTLERGEHVALVGPNGSGKTTLLETILGRRRALAGSIRLGHGVVPAYFSQDEVELEESKSLVEAVEAATGLPRPQAQALLGRFLFSGRDEHTKAVGVLSGGERRRLALALAVASGANLLLLDEPTNHLDLESREALEAALEAFTGTVLLVSHDRAVVDALAERTIAVEDGTIRVYDGGWAELVRRRASARDNARVDATQERKRTQATRREAPKPKSSSAPAAPLDEIEGRIEAQELLVASLERELAEDWADADKIAAHRRARDELQALFARWEALVDEAAC